MDACRVLKNLTLLQESLGGNAKTSLVIAVANALQHVDETLQSLQFGSRAMRVHTQAVVNEHTDFKIINAELVAALDKREDKAHLLEATLLAKEEQLEALGSLQEVNLKPFCCFVSLMSLPQCSDLFKSQPLHVDIIPLGSKETECIDVQTP